VALAIAGCVVGAAAPTQAATKQAGPRTLNVVALGDSYASGTGAGDYQDGTGVPNGCWRSANSYSETLVERLRGEGVPVSFANVSCSGATTSDLSQPFKGEPPQLDALTRNTHVVSLTVGTSDIDFAGYGAQCIAADCSGPAAQEMLSRMPAVGENVAALLAEIKARSPKAVIVMTGYGSQLTEGENAQGVPLDPICDPAYFSSQERVDGNAVARALDATLRATAQEANATFVSPYVDSVNLHPTFEGHSLCESTEPYYRGLEALAPGQEGMEAVLHLNAAGQGALADLIQEQLVR
jgi:lysophospholipase L1-like esterase